MILILTTAMLTAGTGRAAPPEGRQLAFDRQGTNLNLQWLSLSNFLYDVQDRASLTNGQWDPMTTVMGSGGVSVLPVSTTNSILFFHVLYPRPDVMAGEPAMTPGGGTTVYITGSGFYAGDLFRIGGVMASNVEYVSATLLRGMAPPLPPGLYTVEVISGQTGDVLATLPDALEVAPPPERMVQEPPGWPPAGPSAARDKELTGHITLIKAFDDEGSLAKTHTKTGHVTLMKAFDDDCDARTYKTGHVTLMKAFDDETPASKTHTKTGHVTLMKAFDDESSARGKELTGHVTLIKAFDDDSSDARAHTKTGHVTLMKAFDDEGSSAKTHTKTGHVTLMKAFDDESAARGKELTGHITLIKAFDDEGAAAQTYKTGHVTLMKAFDDDETADARTCKTGHVTLMKAFDDDAAASARGKELTGHVTLIKFDDAGEAEAARQKEITGHVTLIKITDDAAPEVRLHSGEVQQQTVDLTVAGRGLDFVWARTYRSRTGQSTAQGTRWTHAYDVRCAQNGTAMDVFDGTGRQDTFRPQTNGVYTCPGFFREGTLTGGVFRLTFADTGFWEFNPLDSSQKAGKLARIQDRNGNAVTCDYDGAGRLSHVVDTLGRTNTIAYNPAGQITSVTDFSGRAATYAYYVSGEAGGSTGDLKSATSPPVTGTPNTNDFPLGKTTTYTYSSGAPDERENHLLLTMTDALGQPTAHCDYDLNPASPSYLGCVSFQRWTNTPARITILPQTPAPDNRFAVRRCIVNDPAGNVSEQFYDIRNRCVTLREFTGRATAGTAVTDTLNRPAGKLRAGDPDFYETQYSWNNDSLCTRHLLAGTTSIQRIYASDLDKSTRARKRADLLTLRVLPVPGQGGDSDGDGVPDLTEITWQYAHDPRFGSDPAAANMRTRINELEARLTSLGMLPSGRAASGSKREECDDADPAFCVSATDPRGTASTATYDARGNLTRAMINVLPATNAPVADFAYDAYGQLTAVTNAADAEGRRSVDTFSWSQGHVTGCVADAGPDGLNLTTVLARDAYGNLTSCVDARGNDRRYTYNALGQCVRAESPTNITARCAMDFFYDANDNLVRRDVELRDDRDTKVSTRTDRIAYDPLHRAIRLMQSADATHSLTNAFDYDADGHLLAARSPLAVSGADPDNQVSFAYDERGLRYRRTCAPGSADALTSQYDYDSNGSLKQYVDDVAAPETATLFEYDGFGRCARVTDPLGNEAECFFDAKGNLTVRRMLGETTDIPGATGNRRLSETRRTYDTLDRPVNQADSFFDIFTGLPLDDGARTTTSEYAPDGQCRSVTDDRSHTTRYTYDTAGRPAVVTGPRGDVRACSRDAAGNVTRITAVDQPELGGPGQTFISEYAYDPLNRCTSARDNAGNTNRWSYDSRGLVTRCTDPRGNSTAYQYDDLGRCASISGYNTDSNRVTTMRVDYDDNSRVDAMTDDNTNTTAYAYDARNRCVATTCADGTARSCIWSPRSNLIREEDAAGTVITNHYDLLDRVVHRDIAAGAGIMPTTTAEDFVYDGLSRVVMASNDISQASFAYDSLGNCVRSEQDGLASTCAYDGAGNLVTRVYPGGMTVHATYDPLNHPAALSVTTGGIATNLAAFSYDGPGRLAGMTRANGIDTRISWNGTTNTPNPPGDFGWQQVAGISHTPTNGGRAVDQRIFGYDHAQNKTLRAQTVPFTPGGEPTTNIWDYDALDRLAVSIITKGATMRQTVYVLDGQGNRTAVMSNGVPGLYSRDATLPEPADFQMDQYTATPSGAQTYDAEGRLLSSIGTSRTMFYHYDYTGRLVQVDALNGEGTVAPAANFTYDALGRRIGKTVYPPVPALPATTQFVYGKDQDCDGRDDDCDTKDPLEIRQDGVLVDSYVHKTDDGVMVARVSATGGTTYYYHCDDLGNVAAVTDSSGNVVERYDYDDYGAPQFLNALGVPIGVSAIGNAFLFHGMFWDNESGLYCASEGKNPFYEAPDTGRLLCRKPGLAKSWGENQRTFANDNPWSIQ